MVLAIGGMAMMLVFGIGARATETGFRLGRTALGAADASVSTESYRALVEGLVLAPGNVVPASYRLTPVNITATRISGDAVLARGTACAPAGPVRDLSLDIVPDEAGSALVCGRPGHEPVVLLRSPRPMTFAASEDGEVWQDIWTNDIEAPVMTGEETPEMYERRLWVRLSDDLGGLDLVGMARSGRPANYYVREQMNLS